MKIGIDFDSCNIVVEMMSGSATMTEEFDPISARALADQLLKSAEAVETFQTERMKANP